MNLVPLRSLVTILILAGTVPRLPADPAAEVAAFSVFKQVDMAKLAKGEVMVASGPAMKFARGMEVASLFVLPGAPQKAFQSQQRWNGARHGELKIYQHVDLPSRPSPGDFQRIGSAPMNSSVRALVSATEKLDPAQPALQMSADEAKRSTKSDGATKGQMPAGVGAFWSGLLHGRVSAFLDGGLPGQPAYFTGGKPVRAIDEANELLRERPGIRRQFSALADSMTSGGSQARSRPELYYELFDVEGRAALSLAATYSRQAGEAIQTGTVQFYSSDGFLVMLTFSQMWPVQIEGKPATLVWRGDLVASSQLGGLRGIERAGSAVAMRKEIQKNVVAMAKDISSNR